MELDVATVLITGDWDKVMVCFGEYNIGRSIKEADIGYFGHVEYFLLDFGKAMVPDMLEDEGPLHLVQFALVRE